MKRVRCPKCDHYIMFNETKYGEGQALVFVCEKCRKEFRIRMGKSNAKPLRKEDFGNIVVVENAFAPKQILPLKEGDNLIGRRHRGMKVDVPVESTDPSMDWRHCYIHVRKNADGEISYTLRDNDSATGTFLMNELIEGRDRRRIEDGAILTLGATTLIFHAAPDNIKSRKA